MFINLSYDFFFPLQRQKTASHCYPFKCCRKWPLPVNCFAVSECCQSHPNNGYIVGKHGQSEPTVLLWQGMGNSRSSVLLWQYYDQPQQRVLMVNLGNTGCISVIIWKIVPTEVLTPYTSISLQHINIKVS